MGKPVEQALGELDFCRRDLRVLRRQRAQAAGRRADRAARRRGLGVHPPQPLRRRCSGSCRGTSPTTRWRASRARTWRSATRSCSSTRPSARSRPRRWSRSTTRPASRRTPTSTSTRRNEQIEWVIGDPRVRGVSLTGSERAGAAVAEIAGRNLKKVVLELGGSDPFILLSTDDLDTAVENAVAARVDNTGQSCNAAKRFIVVDELYEPFLEKFTAAITAVEPGDPTKAETEIGPLSSSDRDRAARRAAQARARQGRQARRRRRARGQLLQDHGADRHRRRQPRPPRGVLRPGRAGLPRQATRRRPSSWPTTRPTASAPT